MPLKVSFSYQARRHYMVGLTISRWSCERLHLLSTDQHQSSLPGEFWSRKIMALWLQERCWASCSVQAASANFHANPCTEVRYQHPEHHPCTPNQKWAIRSFELLLGRRSTSQTDITELRGVFGRDRHSAIAHDNQGCCQRGWRAGVAVSMDRLSVHHSRWPTRRCQGDCTNAWDIQPSTGYNISF